jgi:hypothetical protein
MFIIEYKKAQQCYIQEWNPNFLCDLHQGMVTNEHQYVTKMALVLIWEVCEETSLQCFG